MIRLTCTQCKTTLEMDDAFAGGVCRCQHCGTIQTVPSHLKATANAATPAGAAVGAKSLYRGGNGSSSTGDRSDPRGNGTGLHDLADVVASSGLSRSSLRKGAPEGRASTPAKPPAAGVVPNRLPLLVAAGGVIVILVGVIIWLAVRGGSTPVPGSNPTGTSSTSGNPNPDASGDPSGGQSTVGPVAPTGVTPPTPSGPHFLSMPISTSKVVYLVDRGSSMRPVFDPIKAAVFSSLDSLSPNNEFAVIFWGRSGEKNWKDLSFPEGGLVRATTDRVQSCKKKFEDTEAVGATDMIPGIQRAASLKPEAIFLVTAKGIDLDTSTIGQVQKALGKSNAKVYTFDLSGGDAQGVLQPIATKTGGTYTKVSAADLR